MLKVIPFIEIIIPFFIGAIFEYMLLPRIAYIAYKKKLLDQPDPRKIHKQSIPRLAGISFLPIICFSTALLIALHNYYYGFNILDIHLTNRLLLCCCSFILLYMVGVMDDLVGVRYKTKFIIQIISAVLISLSGLWINNLYGLFGFHQLPPSIGIPISVILIVFVINAINLIDGLDGLAAGISGITLLVLGILFFIIGQHLIVFFTFSTLGVVCVFFCFNMSGKFRKKIFMGDTGSLSLGLFLSILIIHISRQTMPVWILSGKLVIIAFSLIIIPLFDVLRVFLHRLRNGYSPFKPDKNHIHHKLLALGIKPHKALLAILLIDLVIVIINFILTYELSITIILIIDIILWTGFNMLLSFKIKERKSIHLSK